MFGALLTAVGASGLFSWGKKLTAAAKVKLAVLKHEGPGLPLGGRALFMSCAGLRG